MAEQVTWEYQQATIPLADALAACNALGAEGWELCAAVAVMVRVPAVQRIGPSGLLEQLAGSGRDMPGVVLFAKRPKVVPTVGDDEGAVLVGRAG